VLTVLASLRAGSALLMLGPADPPERHAAQMAAVDARARIGELPRWQDLPDDDSDPVRDLGADALFFGTSGSTAASKLVAQTQRNAIANAVGLGRHHGLRPGDRVLGCLPIHHVNGLHFTVLGTMVAGAHTILADAFSPFSYPSLLDEFRPRIASVVPSILEALSASWRKAVLSEGFEYFVSAAAPLPVRTARLVADKLGARVVQGYGLSETTNFSATMPPHLPEDVYRRVMLETDIPPVGVAIHGNDVAVLDRDCMPVPAGTVGEVCMRGHNVMSRYAGNPEATAEAFHGGWFHSQDLGYLSPDEGFLVLTGRIKNIAKVSGETVSLEEMDRVLCALPQVRDAACVATADRFTGEAIVAAVVLADGADPATLEPHLRARFAAAVLPTRYVRMAEIPRSSTGKLLRPQLSRQIAGN
jgi:acyl-CoA synthetase (AMP-forming)/AMP-acid ligase II